MTICNMCSALLGAPVITPSHELSQMWAYQTQPRGLIHPDSQEKVQNTLLKNNTSLKHIEKTCFFRRHTLYFSQTLSTFPTCISSNPAARPPPVSSGETSISPSPSPGRSGRGTGWSFSKFQDQSTIHFQHLCFQHLLVIHHSISFI